MKKVVALLDSMWNWEGCHTGDVLAARSFRINPDNTSGKRLYKLVGPYVDLWVTNSCREMCNSANHHGKPDPQWVKENLALLAPFDVLLVCGAVAKQTYLSVVLPYPNVYVMDHPAARRWTNVKMGATAAAIQKRLA